MRIDTIDGLFLTQRITGIQRYAYEICRELDKLLAPDCVECLVPENTPLNEMETAFVNIRVVKYGKHSGMLWEQRDLAAYLKAKNRRGIFLCNVMPLTAKNGVAVIHDISYRVNPQFFRGFRRRLSAWWHCLQYRLICQKCEKIITVSEFSKSEIERVYHVPGNRIAVVYNAWQHMERVGEDTNTFQQFSQLQKGNYYFAMATLMENKNFAWILRAAKQNPTQQFAVAGGGNLAFYAQKIEREALKNVSFLGYVSDAQAKALMHFCKAFLFPTFYEGFGIPPLEAAACGAPDLIVSDTPCMHEVYGDCAAYVDPHAEPGNLSAIPHKNPAPVLSQYSWAAEAQKFLMILRGEKGDPGNRSGKVER